MWYFQDTYIKEDYFICGKKCPEKTTVLGKQICIADTKRLLLYIVWLTKNRMTPVTTA